MAINVCSSQVINVAKAKGLSVSAIARYAHSPKHLHAKADPRKLRYGIRAHDSVKEKWSWTRVIVTAAALIVFAYYMATHAWS